jgi:hypothetical protein
MPSGKIASWARKVVAEVQEVPEEKMMGMEVDLKGRVRENWRNSFISREWRGIE